MVKVLSEDVFSNFAFSRKTSKQC